MPERLPEPAERIELNLAIPPSWDNIRQHHTAVVQEGLRAFWQEKAEPGASQSARMDTRQSVSQES